MILLTGPTGSGKTTTLYAALRELNKVTSNIITAEDPVEYRLHGVNQVHINTKAGLTFASTLRAILRQDPDIIMVGEIRDAETAEIAVRAAITGHLVLSTLHTNDTVSTITRLVDMGIESFLVATSVVGVISQRLVKRICPKCKKEIPCTEEDMRNLKISKPTKLYKGAGCRECSNSGYKGRIGVHEILVMDKNVKALITRGESSAAIRSAAESVGMVSLADSCRRLVVEGITTIEEMLRVAYSIDE
jgi:type IV pilus assembly protein PilB